MGAGGIGGNGSVHWRIDADYPLGSMSRSTAGGGSRHVGVDMNANEGQFFTVSVKPPDGSDAEAFLQFLRSRRGLRRNGRRVEFRLEIERHSPEQIMIKWPRAQKKRPSPSHYQVMARRLNR